MFYVPLNDARTGSEPCTTASTAPAAVDVPANRWRFTLSRASARAHLDEVRRVIVTPQTRAEKEQLSEADKLQGELLNIKAPPANGAFRKAETIAIRAEALLAEVRFSSDRRGNRLQSTLQEQAKLLRALAADRLGSRLPGSEIGEQLDRTSIEIDSLFASKSHPRRRNVEQLQRNLDQMLDQLLSINQLPARMDRLQHQIAQQLAVAAAAERATPQLIAPDVLERLQVAIHGLLDRITSALDPKQTAKNEAFVDGAQQALDEFSQRYPELALFLPRDEEAYAPVPEEVKALGDRLTKVSEWITELPAACPDDVVNQLKRRQATLEADINKLRQIAPWSHPPLTAAIEAGIGQLDADLRALGQLAQG